MIKTIHLIVLGDKVTLSNIEQSCLDSIKRIYPDWKIRIWRNEDCIEWIKESPFATYNYERGMFAYVSDYLRCRILYECGGLYMDTDVYAMKRIPDSYFERNFLAWDVYNVTTNNGTCFYAKEPKQKIFQEFSDTMRYLEYPVKMRNNSGAVNDAINKVLEKYGLDMSKEGYCDRDQDLGEIVVLNRIEFGGRGTDYEGCVREDVEPYLIHTCSGSWTVPFFWGYINLYYAIIYKDTDIAELKRRVAAIINEKKNSAVFEFFLTYQAKFPDDELREILGTENKFYKVYFAPCGDERRKVLDYAAHKTADIHSCSDIMRKRNV